MNGEAPESERPKARLGEMPLERKWLKAKILVESRSVA